MAGKPFYETCQNSAKADFALKEARRIEKREGRIQAFLEEITFVKDFSLVEGYFSKVFDNKKAYRGIMNQKKSIKIRFEPIISRQW